MDTNPAQDTSLVTDNVGEKHFVSRALCESKRRKPNPLNIKVPKLNPCLRNDWVTAAVEHGSLNQKRPFPAGTDPLLSARPPPSVPTASSCSFTSAGSRTRYLRAKSGCGAERRHSAPHPAAH